MPHDPSSIDDDVRSHLPLRPVVFSILLGLSDASLHGHAIMEWTNERLGGRAILGPGTLYRLLKELKEDGWIEHAAEDTAREADGRRQYYRLSALGRRVAAAEARRLNEIVGLEQAKALLSDSSVGG